MSVLVIDVGTSGLRAAVVRWCRRRCMRWSTAPSRPPPRSLDSSSSTAPDSPPRCSTWPRRRSRRPDRSTPSGSPHSGRRRSCGIATTGEPIGPGLGWQDLRTVFDCITAKSEHGLALAPNQSATKVAWLLEQRSTGARDRDLCFGTVDTWIAWVLSGGAVHVTDPSNAAVTGLLTTRRHGVVRRTCAQRSAYRWRCCRRSSTRPVCSARRRRSTARRRSPRSSATSRPASSGRAACARAWRRSRSARAACSTVCTGATPPRSARRSEHGTFPIVAWSRDGERTWGVEAIMLSAGTNVEWLRDDLGAHRRRRRHSHDVAAQCDHTDGVVYVPALLGLGTPQWDYGARGTLLGLTRGTGRPQIVRAVLEGIAHRGADLVEAAEADYGDSIGALRVDGGMSENPTFVQALANATGRADRGVPADGGDHASGAAYLAGLAVGTVGLVRRHRRGVVTARRSSSRPLASIASSGPPQSNGPAHGYQTCRLSTSRIAPLTLGKQG